MSARGSVGPRSPRRPRLPPRRPAPLDGRVLVLVEVLRPFSARQIALKDAGAQRRVLLLRDQEPQIEAEALTGPDAVSVNFRPPPPPMDLPDSILRYVIRTQESIILFGRGPLHENH